MILEKPSLEQDGSADQDISRTEQHQVETDKLGLIEKGKNETIDAKLDSTIVEEKIKELRDKVRVKDILGKDRVDVYKQLTGRGLSKEAVSRVEQQAENKGKKIYRGKNSKADFFRDKQESAKKEVNSKEWQDSVGYRWDSMSDEERKEYDSKRDFRNQFTEHIAKVWQDLTSEGIGISRGSVYGLIKKGYNIEDIKWGWFGNMAMTQSEVIRNDKGEIVGVKKNKKKLSKEDFEKLLSENEVDIEGKTKIRLEEKFERARNNFKNLKEKNEEAILSAELERKDAQELVGAVHNAEDLIQLYKVLSEAGNIEGSDGKKYHAADIIHYIENARHLVVEKGNPIKNFLESFQKNPKMNQELMFKVVELLERELEKKKIKSQEFYQDGGLKKVRYRKSSNASEHIATEEKTEETSTTLEKTQTLQEIYDVLDTKEQGFIDDARKKIDEFLKKDDFNRSDLDKFIKTNKGSEKLPLYNIKDKGLLRKISKLFAAEVKNKVENKESELLEKSRERLNSKEDLKNEGISFSRDVYEDLVTKGFKPDRFEIKTPNLKGAKKIRIPSDSREPLEFFVDEFEDKIKKWQDETKKETAGAKNKGSSSAGDKVSGGSGKNKKNNAQAKRRFGF